MEEIIKILQEGNFSCVIRKGETRTFFQRGIADLYGLLKHEPDFLSGALIADKVVGKAAAAIMILGEIKELYAETISLPALALLCESDIHVGYGQTVSHIENRDKTDWCPLEKLSYNEESAEKIFPLIEGFIQRMKNISVQ
jgi:iron complex outermembrane receptor protein